MAKSRSWQSYPKGTGYGLQSGELRHFKILLVPANNIRMFPEDSVYGAWPASGEIDIAESRGNAPG